MDSPPVADQRPRRARRLCRLAFHGPGMSVPITPDAYIWENTPTKSIHESRVIAAVWHPLMKTSGEFFRQYSNDVTSSLARSFGVIRPCPISR